MVQATQISSGQALSLPSVSALRFSGQAPSSDHNLQRLSSAQEVIAKSSEQLGTRPVKLALAGYSAAPNGYERPTTQFLQKLVQQLSPVNVGVVTSPTADEGSIDAIGTTVAQKANVPILYVTCEDYVPYINPDKFPATLNKTSYKAAPKYVFPDAAEYGKAQALGSNALLITGGRDTTVGDFVNAIENGNKVVILDNQALGGVNWDDAKGRPNNGARYIIEQLEAFKRGEELPYPPTKKGFGKDFLQANQAKIDKLVKVVTVSPESNVNQAVKEAARHLLG